MSANIKARWQALRRGKPGRRFQDRYEASRKSAEHGVVSRVVRVVIAALAVAIGLVLVFIPGPAILFFAIAGALLASESRLVARFLDWSEVRIRRLVGRGMRLWRRLSWWSRIAACTLVVLVAAAAAFAAYRLTFG